MTYSSTPAPTLRKTNVAVIVGSIIVGVAVVTFGIVIVLIRRRVHKSVPPNQHADPDFAIESEKPGMGNRRSESMIMDQPTLAVDSPSTDKVQFRFYNTMLTRFII